MITTNLSFNLPYDLFKIVRIHEESATFRELFGHDGIRSQQIRGLLLWIVENRYEYDLLSWIEKDGRFVGETNLQELFIKLNNSDAHRRIVEYFRTELVDPGFKAGEYLPFEICEGSDKWKVLTIDRANRRALVLSDKAFGTFRNEEKTKDWKWSETPVNKYLNTEYVKFFPENVVVSVDHITSGEVTNEKVFLLSKDEVERYLPYIPGVNSCTSRVLTERIKKPINWALRDANAMKSNKYNGDCVYYVTTEGEISQYFYSDECNALALGVRPAMWIKY